MTLASVVSDLAGLGLVILALIALAIWAALPASPTDSHTPRR